MLATAWDCLKGLFGGKGATQIGKANESVSGVTIGDGAMGVTIGNQVHVHHAAPQVASRVELEATPAEVEILLRLAKSQNGYLNAVRFDGGFEVLIDGHQLGGTAGGQTSVQLHEAMQRLLRHGLLTDIQHNGQIYHLSSQGRDAAAQLQRQLDRGERPDYSEIERLMPGLLAEMREDFDRHPLIREIILLDSEEDVYNGGEVLTYHRDKHPDLDSKFQILENHGLVQNITYDNVDRFRVLEQFARYLSER